MSNLKSLEVSWALGYIKDDSKRWNVMVSYRTDVSSTIISHPDASPPIGPLVLNVGSFDPNIYRRVHWLVDDVRQLLSKIPPVQAGTPAIHLNSLSAVSRYIAGWEEEGRSPGFIYWRWIDKMLGSASGDIPVDSLSVESRATLHWLDERAREAAYRHYNETAEQNHPRAAVLPFKPELSDALNSVMDLRIVSGRYKSIGLLEWIGIPRLAVLTGVNGSGKTQLLEAIHSYLTRSADSRRDHFHIDTGQVILEASRVVYVASEMKIANLPAMDIATYRQTIQQLHQAMRSSQSSLHMGLVEEVERRAKKKLQDISLEEFAEHLPPDFSLYPAQDNVLEGLTAVFLKYRADRSEMKEREPLSDDEVRERIGTPPWELLNELLAVTDFPYRVEDPAGSWLTSTYTLRLRSLIDAVVIEPADLSSGEKVILSLVIWLYRSEHYGRFPQLLLLDEPDAHLHPSLTRQFLDAIQTVLVDKYGVRVILTTHSPSTVALAPEGSVFEMRRLDPRVVRSESRARTVALLTAGLVTVGPATRYVFVEDEDDAIFYSTVDELLREASSEAPTFILAPSVVFLAASVGKAKEKESGGLKKVRLWVEKLHDVGLPEFFQGLIDRDHGNEGGSSVHVLPSRHSLENYLLDPLVVYATLLAVGLAPRLPGVSLRRGDEHKLRGLSAATLQQIASGVLGQIERHLGVITPEEAELVAIQYVGGPDLLYPSWLLNRRGKDLLQAVRTAFNAGNVINPVALNANFRRLQMIPAELVWLLNNIRMQTPKQAVPIT